MDVDVHIERVLNSLETRQYCINLKVEEILKLSGNGNNRVKITAVLKFYDDSQLHYYEIVETGKCFPQIIKYSYQYLRKDEEIFRYDNSPHHPDVPTYPDHKHIVINNLRQVISSSRPSLDKLFGEISSLIETNIT